MTTVFHPDTLSLIFVFVFDGNPTPWTTTTLRSVSSSWMFTAGRTPHLWTSLTLDRPPHFTNIQRTQLYIQNSKNHPLTVSLFLPNGVGLDTNTREVTVLLRENISRFRILNIHGESHTGIEALISIGNHTAAPTLEELNITVGDGVVSNEIRHFESITTAFIPAPRLRQIHMPAWPMPLTVTPHFSPAITSLYFNGIDFSGVWTDTIISLIKLCPNLEDFTYKGRDDYTESDAAELDYTDTIFLPRLTTVDVTAPGVGLDLLRAFNAPQLSALRLDGWRAISPSWRWVDWIFEYLTITLQCTADRSPNLTKLELCFLEVYSPAFDYQRILSGELFPRLKELVLDAMDVRDESLVRSAGKTSSLKRVEFHRCSHITGPGLLRYVNGKDQEITIAVKDCKGVGQNYLEDISTMVRLVVG